MDYVPGLCQCGCGEPTTVSPRTDRTHGYEKGVPRRYINGHSTGLPQTWLEEDFGFETRCWIWQGGTSGQYGWARGFRTFAHRVTWMKLNGPIPRNMTLHHLCSQTLCVRPDHLDLVSRSEHREIHQGESGRRTRLSKEAVQDIRTSDESLRAMGRRYGITYAYASKIRRGEALAHL